MFDPMMSKYSVIILDEAHERTLATDILFGLLKDVLKLRPELKCLVMSATLEAKKFQDYWNGAPLLQVPGRMYPVEVFFDLVPAKDYVQEAIETVGLIHLQEPPGDILLFLNGEDEIETACYEIEQNGDGKLWVLPLYSSLPMNRQREVFDAAPVGIRKVVVATNIAETSVTIDGVVYVVDPGLSKQKLYNPRTHVDSLLVSPISRASAMQRAGRAGRTRPGKCFRLYTLETFKTDLLESTYPEIIRSNLCSVVLTLLTLGKDDLVKFDFMEPPSPEAMMRALDMLHHLGAIDQDSETKKLILTEDGRNMSEFPVDPHLAKALMAAARRGCCDEVIIIIAMLSVPPPFQRPRHALKAADRAHKAFASGLGDHLSLLSTYNQYEGAADGKSQFCKDNFLQERSMKQVDNICRQLRAIAQKRNLLATTPALESGGLTVQIRKSLIEGFFMQCSHIDQGGKNYLSVQDQQMVKVHPGSFLNHMPEWVLFHETVVTDRCYMRNVTAIAPEMLIEVAPQFYNPKKETCKLGDVARKSLERALPRLNLKR